jgi:predicted nucleic acid-binding protein
VLTVIDTQSVLDWQFFHHPACAGWTASLTAGHWHWIASTALRDELAHVLARGFDPRWTMPADSVLGFFDTHAELVVQPEAGLFRHLQCTDPDDQKFIDLAVGHRARWLVSRDRAVLKLRRRALQHHGLTIVPPHAWTPGPATAT